MANQCKQLLGLLEGEGAQVELVRTNAPYSPAFVGRVPVLRAFARLVPYLFALWRASGRSDVMHVLANSGWSWHLFSAPAIWIARLRGTPVIVNYRGRALFCCRAALCSSHPGQCQRAGGAIGLSRRRVPALRV
jgi:hypothetical protein